MAAGIIGLLALLAAIPKEIWIVIGVLGAIWVVHYFHKSKAVPEPAENGGAIRQIAHASARPSVPNVTGDYPAGAKTSTRFTEDSEPVSASVSPPSRIDFRIPPAPKGFGPATWIPRGQSVEVAGISIPGGMIYVGTSLKTAFGDDDPCLINPSKSVSAHGDYTERQMGYWPSYSEIPATARRAYLNWLADGRRDPEADIGYVFLFFYGLERRAVIDASKDTTAQADRPAMAEEIQRLLGIYGEKSHSFRRYASELLDLISLANHPPKLYELPIPTFPKTFELPMYVRLALGQSAVDATPVPAHLALAWAKLDPSVSLRTPAIRCGEQFDKLFQQKYTEVFGAGMALPRNRTKLKMVYRPASAGFRGYNEIKLTFGETPDVTALTAPLKKLQQIVDVATKELEPYSRYIGKNPDAPDSLEGVLQLPTTLWPESAQQALQALNTRIGSGMVVMAFQDVLSALGAKSAFTKEKTLTLARALETMNIGIEPDVAGGAKTPKPGDSVVLFNMPLGGGSHATPSYQAALLTLELAAAVASADGDFSATEINTCARRCNRGRTSHRTTSAGFWHICAF